MSNDLRGGSVRILWDADDSAEVTITRADGSPARFTVGGSTVTFPYALGASTTFETPSTGDYVVSVLHHGIEVANTPDGVRPVHLSGGQQFIFAPTPDAVPTAKFTSDLFAGLSDAYATTRQGRPGNLVAAMGDSITAYDQSQIQQNGGAFHRLVAASLGRIRSIGGPYATGGYTLEQMESTHLPTILALDPKPGACIVFGGTNNTGASSGAGFNFTTASATLDRIIGSLRGAGIIPILVLIPPRGDSSVVRANVTKWNTHVWLRAQQLGLPLLDAFTPVVDPSSGGYLSGYSSDGVHPTEQGYQAIVSHWVNVQGILDLFATGRPHAGLYAEAGNLVPSGNGLALADANADGVADGWSLAGSGTSFTASRVTPVTGDNLKGQWQQLAQAAAGTGSRWLQIQLSSGWSVGDRLLATARFQTEGFDSNTTANFSMGLLTVGSGSTPKGIYLWKRDLADGLFQMDMTVPSGTTAVYFRFISDAGASGAAAATKVRVGEVTVRNLTTLGLG